MFLKTSSGDEIKPVDAKKQKIFFAIPNTGQIRTETVEWIQEVLLKSGYHVISHYPQSNDGSNNRNGIVQTFLKSDCDILIQCDSDIVPHPKILDLLEYDKDIITGLLFTISKGVPWHLACKQRSDGSFEQMDLAGKKDLIEVDGTGTGFLITKRRVFEHPALKAPFMRKWSETGQQIIGHDYYFCQKAREAGFKIFVHTAYDCGHVTDMDLRKYYQAKND